jgi:dinuclear metal center YbgI/SA1388 family protein
MNLTLTDIATYLESIAPLSLQESYDNSGLQVGLPGQEIHSALIAVDVTEDVLDEAIDKKCNLIVSHHPLIFNGLKKLTGRTFVERIILKAIKNDIAIYAGHTNFDSIQSGVNARICEKLHLQNIRILKPASGLLKKLVTFIPAEQAEKVREAVFRAGAGQIGNYDRCSFNSEGLGSFRGNEKTHPFVGQKGVIHFEKEIRFETIFPAPMQKKIVDALLKTHPYEEVAYDIYPVENKWPSVGMGMIGDTESPETETDYLLKIKRIFNAKIIRHTKPRGELVRKVAVCGGTGSFLLEDAMAANADVFITADFKYHQFFGAEDKVVIADIGHYESEQFTKELFYELLREKFPKFAVRLSERNTNPVEYL